MDARGIMIERHEKKNSPRVLKPDLAGEPSTALHTGIQKCETCGNEYDKPLEIVVNGISHYFDSFECAIHALAPKCSHCECRIIGHGIEASGVMYCCASCAQHSGVTSVKDRAN
jgi:hypothetical protein